MLIELLPSWYPFTFLWKQYYIIELKVYGVLVVCARLANSGHFCPVLIRIQLIRSYISMCTLFTVMLLYKCAKMHYVDGKYGPDEHGRSKASKEKCNKQDSNIFSTLAQQSVVN